MIVLLQLMCYRETRNNLELNSYVRKVSVGGKHDRGF